MFECCKQGSVFVVASREPLTRENTSKAATSFAQCYEKGQPRVVVNLQGVPLMDSAGLELLLDARDRCAQRGAHCIWPAQTH